VEAIILAGGKAERLGDVAGGLPKPLVPVAGRPLAAWQIGLLGRVGVERVIVSRGGGIRFAANERQESGDVFALNGDELVDVDFPSLLETHRANGAAATITVARPKSPFGVVELDDGRVTGFAEGGPIECWVSCGVYVLGEDALARFPERGDHETTAFPELAAEGKLGAFRHEGLWLTINTPKDLRQADEYVGSHPEWLQA
jgi:NDP-sugar pyrophosphorylase family protein